MMMKKMSMMKMAKKGGMKMSMMMKKKSMGMKMMKAMAMKKAMKKTAKAYKTVAGANRAVFSGLIAKSKGGLTKAGLMKSKKGKIVSSKKSALGKKNKWIKACNAAKAALKIKGFVAIKKGTALYK